MSTRGGYRMSAIELKVAEGPLTGAGDVLAIPVAPADGAPVIGRGGDALAGLGVDGDALLAAKEATGKAGEVVEVPVARDGVAAVLLVGRAAPAEREVQPVVVHVDDGLAVHRVALRVRFARAVDAAEAGLRRE